MHLLRKKLKNNLYRILYDTRLKLARIEPSEYLTRLFPQDAVAELKSRVEQLGQRLAEVQETFAPDAVDMSEAIETGREWIMEIELAQQYISYLREHHDLNPLHSRKAKRLHVAV